MKRAISIFGHVEEGLATAEQYLAPFPRHYIVAQLRSAIQVNTRPIGQHRTGFLPRFHGDGGKMACRSIVHGIPSIASNKHNQRHDGCCHIAHQPRFAFRLRFLFDIGKQVLLDLRGHSRRFRCINEVEAHHVPQFVIGSFGNQSPKLLQLLARQFASQISLI